MPRSGVFLNLSDGRRVFTTDYVSAKTKDLVLSGYADLSEAAVLKQLEKILSGDKNLSVIGKFMENDIIKPEKLK